MLRRLFSLQGSDFGGLRFFDLVLRVLAIEVEGMAGLGALDWSLWFAGLGLRC